MDLTLPQNEYPIAHSPELARDAAVALPVPVDFLRPVLTIRLRALAPFAAVFVTVPEATVNKEEEVRIGEVEIGLAGQLCLLPFKLEPLRSKLLCYTRLGLRIRTADLLHQTPPLGL